MNAQSETQQLIDYLANIALTEDKPVSGVALRRRLSGTREQRAETLRTLVPSLLRRTGKEPEDHYMLTPLGVLQTDRGEFFRRVATEFRDFIRERFQANERVKSFSWDDVVQFYTARSEPVPLSIEGGRFVFTCIGVWGGGGNQFSAPSLAHLEDLLEIDEIEEILRKIHTEFTPTSDTVSSSGAAPTTPPNRGSRS